MSGENVSVTSLGIPPGIFSDYTQYGSSNRWYDGNMVRWVGETLIPIGGWRSVTTLTGLQPIRAMLSWRDHLKAPWLAAGSADKLWGLAVEEDQTFTTYDITPTTLAWNPGGLVGWGRGAWGSGPWGLDDAGGVGLDQNALWSMDNFGKLLIAVHSQDGRLFQWDPSTPSTPATVVLNAPVDNTLCITTNEEFCMVLGGKNNPRRVKWATQRTLTDWLATEVNTAGGFDLQSHGTIIGVIKVPEGVLVITNSDVHLIQYIGAPNYYGRRRISDEGSIISSNCLVSIPGGAIWMGNSDFWIYLGGTVTKLPCSVHTEVFYKSELTQPQNVFLGVNEFAGEVWAFMPISGETIPSKYYSYSYVKEPFWSKGRMSRTAWTNPVWQSKPFAANDQIVYEQEFGMYADGVSRNDQVFAETGAMEIGEGNNVARVDRIWPDSGVIPDTVTGSYGSGLYGNGLYGTSEANAPVEEYSFNVLFKVRQAPNAVERLEGPYNLFSTKGYVTVRFRARQMVMRITQVRDVQWTLGKLRLRLKSGGKR